MPLSLACQGMLPKLRETFSNKSNGNYKIVSYKLFQLAVILAIASQIPFGEDLGEVTQVVTVSQDEKRYSIKNQTDDLLDEFFFVEINNIFLDIPEASIDIINIDNTVVYRVGTTTDTNGRTQLIFRVTLKGFSQSQFDTYKITAASSYVKNFIKITGATSGLTKNTEIRIVNS